MLRHAMGLSAWKQAGASRWALRVNPSSGNLHPTEAYIVCGPMDGLSAASTVYHYSPEHHALEQRCAFDAAAWVAACEGRPVVMLVALTSIHWREAWKYGERAFRYCQHDLGHAIAALSFSAALLGWRATLLPTWSHQAIATLAGLNRDEDFTDAEPEEPGCVMAILPNGAADPVIDAMNLGRGVRGGRWTGRASQLSEDHVEWTFIEEIARATADPGRAAAAARATEPTGDPAPGVRPRPATRSTPDARATILRRRSAVSLDGMSRMGRAEFVHMLERVMPASHAPWDALWWTPRIHLVLFVHRVDEVAPGVYLLARDPRVHNRLRDACGRAFLWEPAHESLPLMLLARGECRALASRLSCDQAIAADGFFSLGMLADFDGSLDTYGASFYRQLFWESGVVGQTLYLEAEAAGARATGIGCFFDDPVHDVLGLEGHAFQSLYHFTVGMPVDDTRLTTLPGYEWEKMAIESNHA